MSGFVVRLTESKELVGVYVASSITHLAQMVDDVVSPLYCEYLPFLSGGLVWSGDAPRIHDRFVPTEDEDIPPIIEWGSPSSNEELDDAIDNEGNWKKITRKMLDAAFG